MNAVSWTPVKKILAAAIGSGLTWVALRLGLDLGTDAVNQAATAIVGLIAGYIVPDPKPTVVVPVPTPAPSAGNVPQA